MEVEKIEKYQNIKREIKRLWKLRKVQIVPVVVVALRWSVAQAALGWSRFELMIQDHSDHGSSKEPMNPL